MTPEDVSDDFIPPPEGWENWPLSGPSHFLGGVRSLGATLDMWRSAA